MTTYDVGDLADCPPNGNQAMEGTFYRACTEFPPSGEDVTSHAASKQQWKRRKANLADCEHWGLSGWASLADARHAKKTLRWLKEKYIVSVPVTKADGVLAQTSGPPHHTFWPCKGSRIFSQSALVFRAGEVPA